VFLSGVILMLGLGCDSAPAGQLRLALPVRSVQSKGRGLLLGSCAALSMGNAAETDSDAETCATQADGVPVKALQETSCRETGGVRSFAFASAEFDGGGWTSDLALSARVSAEQAGSGFPLKSVHRAF
jgi:hypothetical protein